MIEIHDELSDTPVVVEHDDGDGEDGVTAVHVTIYSPDGSWRSGTVNATNDVAVEQLARMIRDAALGAAAAGSTDLWMALQLLFSGHPPEVTG